MRLITSLLIAAAFALALFVKSTGSLYLYSWLSLFYIACGMLLFTGRHQLDPGAFTKLLIAWGVVVVMSAFLFRVTINGASPAVGAMLTLPVVYALSLMRPDRKEIILSHVVTVGTLLFALAVYTCLQWFGGVSNPHWPLSNPNNLAAMMAVGLIVSVGVIHRTKYALITAGVFALAMVATGSRGAILACVIALLFVVNKNNWFRLTALVAGIFLAAVIVDNKGGLDSLFYSADVRLGIWAVALRAIESNPLMGTGLGSFPIIQHLYMPGEIVLERGMMVHNDMMQFALEMGIPAMLIFYSLCLVALVKTNQKAMIPFAVLFVVILHTHVSLNMYIPAIQVLIAIAVGYWMCQVREEKYRLPDYPEDNPHYVLGEK